LCYSIRYPLIFIIFLCCAVEQFSMLFIRNGNTLYSLGFIINMENSCSNVFYNFFKLKWMLHLPLNINIFYTERHFRDWIYSNDLFNFLHSFYVFFVCRFSIQWGKINSCFKAFSYNLINGSCRICGDLIMPTDKESIN
jgi:hypothetical protein